MKKYLIFGIISGMVFAKLYPLWDVLLVFQDYYISGDGIKFIIKSAAFAVCIFIPILIWVKLKAEFSVKKLLLLIAGCVVGMALITSWHLYVLMTTTRNGVVYSYSLGPLSVNNVALSVALDFKNTSAWISHFAMLVMQLIPYFITCFGLKLKNKI